MMRDGKILLKVGQHLIVLISHRNGVLVLTFTHPETESMSLFSTTKSLQYQEIAMGKEQKTKQKNKALKIKAKD